MLADRRLVGSEDSIHPAAPTSTSGAEPGQTEQAAGRSRFSIRIVELHLAAIRHVASRMAVKTFVIDPISNTAQKTAQLRREGASR